MAERVILHIDMDAFFASIEQLDDPSLRGRPVLVGHDGPRGVVTAASYEARPFGCRSAIPMAAAKRMCPEAVVVPVRFVRYREVSQRMFAILDEFSPLVEPLSVDEAFVDLTGTERLLGGAVEVAMKLKGRIRSVLQLTASVGIAPNKHLAKLASDLRKPDGVMVIEPGDIDRVLLPLPVTKLWGIGKVTGARLAKAGITTIADLRGFPSDRMAALFGEEADWYYRLARGIDDRPVVADRDAKSMGHERTFSVNLQKREEVLSVLLEQVEQVGHRLRRQGFFARGISLKIRFGDFETVSRSATLPRPTQLTEDLWRAARETFAAWPFRPVRLIGVTAERLLDNEGQLELFATEERAKAKQIDAVWDRINEKFGKGSIRRGK